MLKNGFDVPSFLQQLPWSMVLEKRNMIKQVAWRLQYALPPRQGWQVMDEMSGRNHTWTPPHADALEIILEKLFDKATFRFNLIS